jgi:hypothetical protein
MNRISRLYNLWIKLPAARGPCGGARQGRRGRPECASARGSRGPWPADGCSAGTYACSLELQVVREDALNQERTCHTPRPAARLTTSQGSTADATWVSLLTVRGIGSEVKLSPQHRDFHNVSTADDLGCGKSWFAGRLGGWSPS